MKQWKKMLVSAGAALTLLLQGTLVGSAAPATKEWLDPFNDASFPLAKAVNMKYPPATTPNRPRTRCSA